jgi:CHAT domain-containing protein
MTGELSVISRLNYQLSGAEGPEQIKLLVQRGEVYQVLGHYGEAMVDYGRAHDLAKAMGHKLLTILADHAMGYLLFLQGEAVPAEALLRSALGKARSLNSSLLVASCTHRLGTVLSGMGRSEEAYLFFREALEQARKANDPGLEAGILRNQAHLLSDDVRAMKKLFKARNLTRQVKPLNERMDLLLGIGAEAQKRKTNDSVLLAFDALNAALALALDRGSVRQQSQALGGLGELYEHLGQWDEAHTVTGQALEKAQAIQAHDLLIYREWQMGRLLRAKGKQNKAVAAYRRAIYHIQAIRHDIPVGNQGGASSFHGIFASIHQGMADLLLSLAAQEPRQEVRQDLFREAQEVVEGTKLSELRDYFRDPCLAALSRGIETLSPDTAVLYPILLPDRLELLVKAGGQFLCKTSPIQRDRLEGQVLELAHRLRKGLAFKEQARKLYDGLLRPVISILEDHKVKTLVHVPDGVLRLLPMAALMDGEHFLVERYALVTVPGLTLLAPAPLGKYQKKTLLAGISDPGPVIYDLPQRYWDTLGNRGGFIPEKAIRGLSLEVADSCVAENSAKQDKASVDTANLVRQALALPGVKLEIERLSGHLSGKVLFNEDFRLEDFSSELQDASYSIVHIASHGFFGGAPEQNFIMTFDRRLDMNLLETLLRPKQLADQPVELITLSACQTAEGDDRSPLGLTGVVVKSGARSALGSLWPVSDLAAQELFPAFYALLDDPDSPSSKAEALRKAQLLLLEQEAFRHPFYWSSFILVGNWL